MLNQNEKSYKLINEVELKRFRLSNPKMDDLEVMTTLTALLAQQLRQWETQRCLNISEKSVPQIKEKRNIGAPTTQIFYTPENRVKFAEMIKTIYRTHYNVQQKRFIINGKAYRMIDFLLAMYFVMVERKVTISIIGNKPLHQFLLFLSTDCGIIQQASDRAFLEHLYRVRVTLCDFHALNDDIVEKFQNRGGLSKVQYDEMKEMTKLIGELFAIK